MGRAAVDTIATAGRALWAQARNCILALSGVDDEGVAQEAWRCVIGVDTRSRNLLLLGLQDLGKGKTGNIITNIR